MFKGSKKPPEKEGPFEVDLEAGTVIRKADGGRVITMGSLGWAGLERELSTTFMTGAAVILQRMGYSYGVYLGRIARGEKKPPDKAFEALLAFARESGWGKLVLNAGDLYQGQARIVVRDCFFCLHIRDSTEPVCHMLAGLVGGVADEIIGKTHRVIEERCIAKGDAVCEVLVERVG